MSGSRSLSVLSRIAARVPSPRVASLRWLHHPTTGERIDQAVVIAFPAPASFTGEDMVELQVHGSVAVCRGLAQVLGGMPGLRQAEPGEFTRRALVNGRLDLAQTEGLGDLLMAETEAQRRLALRLMEGSLSRAAEAWRADLIRAMGLVEAGIDFVDEDLPDDLSRTARALVAGVTAGMRHATAGSGIAERLRDGFDVALVGKPNVGKSTLLNHLAGREAALTSATPGTTRDVIEVRMDLDGVPVTLLDMAGLREPGDPVEALGVSRARERAAAADLRVFLLEPGDDQEALGVPLAKGDIIVGAKADLGRSCSGLAVSGSTGQGVDALLERLRQTFSQLVSSAGMVSHARQRDAIQRALGHAREAEMRLGNGDCDVELAAADLQRAVRALDGLLGRSDVDAVLDFVFSSFCIGK